MMLAFWSQSPLVGCRASVNSSAPPGLGFGRAPRLGSRSTHVRICPSEQLFARPVNTEMKRSP
jgi:hypothetical protein